MSIIASIASQFALAAMMAANPPAGTPGMAGEDGRAQTENHRAERRNGDKARKGKKGQKNGKKNGKKGPKNGKGFEKGHGKKGHMLARMCEEAKCTPEQKAAAKDIMQQAKADNAPHRERAKALRAQLKEGKESGADDATLAPVKEQLRAEHQAMQQRKRAAVEQVASMLGVEAPAPRKHGEGRKGEGRRGDDKGKRQGKPNGKGKGKGKGKDKGERKGNGKGRPA